MIQMLVDRELIGPNNPIQFEDKGSTEARGVLRLGNFSPSVREIIRHGKLTREIYKWRNLGHSRLFYSDFVKKELGKYPRI